MNNELINKIAELAYNAGGRAYFVGGYVRDLLMGKEPFDADIEIHGLESGKIEEILDECGQRQQYGKSFGIYSLKGEHLDIALPRREKLVGSRHKDFDVELSPFMGLKEACKRRDFTVNAMMQDILTGEILDFYGGREDLENKIIRHVNSDSFKEDALRVLRGAQFAARFEFDIAPETAELCSSIDLSLLSRERIFEETKKALLMASRPSGYFEVLRSFNRLDFWFPELSDLIGVEQNPKYHPEGDVWNHTMEVLDRAAEYRQYASDSMGFMLSALVHDFGKAVTTEYINGAYHAYGHEIEGESIALRFLERITADKKLKEYSVNMLKNHMRPNMVAKDNGKVKSTNRLFDESIDPLGLIYLACADIGSEKYIPFLKERLEIYNSTMSGDYITGKELIAAGVAPGRELGNYLDYAHKLRLAGVCKEEALKQVMAMARGKYS